MLPYRTAMMRALNRALVHRDSSIFVVIKFSDRDNYVLITHSKDTFMGTAEVIMHHYVTFILRFVKAQYLTLKARHGVADEPERGSSLDSIAALLISDNLFISTMMQKLNELTVDQVHLV